MTFNPDSTASRESGLFGLPFSADQSLIHLIPVPWEVTTSYGAGASRGPAAILRASHQVDLFDLETGESYQRGYFLQPESNDVKTWNRDGKEKAQRILKAIERADDLDPATQRLLAEVNTLSDHLNAWVLAQSQEILAKGKIPAVVGGDHSSPFGLMQALSQAHAGKFGILHIDAHADLRQHYQGYRYSHASIMHNVMQELSPQRLVQVGIRDFSRGEYDYIQANSRVTTFFDQVLKRRQQRGETWQNIAGEIIAALPENVYISFDIDGLTPDLCPNTGTPVPGGLSFSEATSLIAAVAESGRRIIGFDINEVAEPEGSEDDWDGNVGARLLYKLCGWTVMSQQRKEARLQE